jgi:hypothetical protein
MTQLEALALSTAQQLQYLLGDLYDLPQHGPGSCVEQAWEIMDYVIWYLDPNAADEAPRVRDAAPGARERFEIRMMLEAGVSVTDCASYFHASEAAVRSLLSAPDDKQPLPFRAAIAAEVRS